MPWFLPLAGGEAFAGGTVFPANKHEVQYLRTNDMEEQYQINSNTFFVLTIIMLSIWRQCLLLRCLYNNRWCSRRFHKFRRNFQEEMENGKRYASCII
jgi:hypothetical protein